MPVFPIKKRIYEDPIDPNLLLFVDFRYSDCYNGGTTITNLANGNPLNVGDGTIIGSPVFSYEEGGSFYFGPGSGIDFSSNVIQVSNRSNLTISAYVKFGVDQGFLGSAFFANSGSGSSSFQVGGDSYSFFGLGPGFRFIYGNIQPTAATFSIGEWYHITWTKEQSGSVFIYKFYLNGILKQTFTGGNLGTSSPNISVGYDKGIGSRFLGTISRVKVSTSVLDGEQVLRESIYSTFRPYTIGTKKTSRDIILYLTDKGTSAGWGDNSIYSNGARLLGGAQFNSGLILSNTSMYAAGTLSIDPGQNFTISSFFTCVGTSTSGYHAIFSINTTTINVSPSTTLILRVSDDLRVEFVYLSNGVVFSDPNVFQKNVPTHLAVTVSQSGGNRIIKLFVNGVLVKNQTVVLSFDFSTRNYKIGRWQDTGQFVHQFNGKIHNVILHNRTLSDNEVQKLYAALPTSYKSNESSQNQIPTSDRVLYVDGAEPASYYLTGLTFSDISGSNRNGTLTQSTVTQGVSTVAGTLPTFSQFNGGHFNFNGFKTTNSANPDQKGNSFIRFSTTNLPSGSDPSTIIAWARVKPSASGQYRYIFSYGTYNATGQNRYVGIKYPTQIGQTGFFSIGGAGVSNESTILNEPGMVPDEWFQIAFVYNNPEMRLFVNGQLLNIKSQTLNTTTPLKSAHIGRSNTDILTNTVTNDGYFYGDIAQVLVYNRALTEQEIYQHYKVTRDRFKAPIVERPTSVSEITPPLVTTVTPSSITTTSAQSGVIVNFNGNSTILTSGILIRLKTQTGLFEFGGTGVTNIPGTNPITISLSPSTNYEIRAYANNGTFYGYGQPIDLTSNSPSALTVLAVTASFTGNYATASGRVTDLGGNINGYKTRGFVWSTSTINVSTANNIPTRAEESKDGTPFWTDLNEQWKLRVTPLSPGTTYYLRSYAKIENGSNVYSNNELVFTTYTFPTLTVTIPTNIDDITNDIAKITGSVNGGNQPILQRGIVWTESTVSQDPTIEIGSVTTNGSGTGTFTGTLNGLSPGTTYYVKAYAISNAGVAYSPVASFTTDTTPVVTTATMVYNNLYPFEFVLGQPKQSATASGTITDISGDTITEVGIIYSTSNIPINVNTVGVGKVFLTSGITNNFSVKLPTLDINTLYYYRAYAINSAGVGYGSILQFETLYTPTVVVINSPNENNNTLGSVTLRAYVNSAQFGNSDYYNQPVTVGFRYAEQPSGTFIEVIVSTNYTIGTSQQTPPNNWFTLDLNLTPGKSYFVRPFAINKGMIEGLTNYNVTVWNVPTVTTTVVSNISFNGAQGGGVVTSNGGSTILSRGVVWTTNNSIDPVYLVNSGTDIPGSTPTTYNAALSPLNGNTTYYYRSYARNSVGVGYDTKLSFTTFGLASVITQPTTAITTNGATLNLEITFLGGYTNVPQIGFYYSTNPSSLPPSGSTSTRVSAQTFAGIGSYTWAVSNLLGNTTYYVKAFAQNQAGDSFGNQVQFTTTLSPVTFINFRRRTTLQNNNGTSNIGEPVSFETGISGSGFVAFDITYNKNIVGGPNTFGIISSNTDPNLTLSTSGVQNTFGFFIQNATGTNLQTTELSATFDGISTVYYRIYAGTQVGSSVSDITYGPIISLALPQLTNLSPISAGSSTVFRCTLNNIPSGYTQIGCGFTIVNGSDAPYTYPSGYLDRQIAGLITVGNSFGYSQLTPNGSGQWISRAWVIVENITTGELIRVWAPRNDTVFKN